MRIRDHFEIAEIADKFTVVDRSTSPGRALSIHDTYEEAQAARDRAAVVPAEWLQDGLLHAFADALSSQRDVPYPDVIDVLETLGVDSVWTVVGTCVDEIGRAAGLIDA